MAGHSSRTGRQAGLAGGAVLAVITTLFGAALQHQRLQEEFARLVRGFDGRVGICADDSAGLSCVNGDQRFPLQSVMKLLVGLAVMDAVDHRRLKLEDRVIIRKQDLSLAVQPLAKLVTGDGFRTTVDDLIRRAIVDSDSAATDFLVERLGVPSSLTARCWIGPMPPCQRRSTTRPFARIRRIRETRQHQGAWCRSSDPSPRGSCSPVR
jgi:beta-lactamase class A